MRLGAGAFGAESRREESEFTRSAFLNDPGCVSQGFSVADCTDQWRVERQC